MNNDIEEIEAFLKPNKTKRRILIVVQTITIALSLLLSLYLFREIEYLERIGQNRHKWFIHAARIIVVLRLIAIIGTGYGRNSDNMLLWTTSGSCIFISYFISGMMNVYVVIVSTDLTARVVSVLLIVGEIILNCIAILCIMIIAYQTICMTSRKATLDMQDPVKEFMATIIKSILSVLPGIGYFSEQLMRMTKME